jgi:ABC-2 type transport system permease protein
MSVQTGEKYTGSLIGKPRGTLFFLILHTMRLQLRSVVIWGIALGLLNLVTVASFPAVEDQSQTINDLVKSYPPEMRDAFGIGDSDLTTIEGFLASQTFNFLAPLALSFFPILAASGAIAGAEERGTIDVLLSNPLPRWQLVVGNFIATALSLLGILAIVGLFTWVPAYLMDINGLSVWETVEAVLNMWPLCMFFGALAMLLSAIFHRRAFATAISGAVLVAMYFVNALGNSVDKLKDAQPYAVFHYYGSAIENGIDWSNFAGIVACALVMLALAILAFRRRDIYT